MHFWQVCHLAMVVPIADAYYKAKNPKDAWKEQEVMIETANIHCQLQYKLGFPHLWGKIITFLKVCFIY